MVIILGLCGAAFGDRDASLIALADRENALNDQSLQDCPAYIISPDKIVLMVPEASAGEVPDLEAARVLPGGQLPLWITANPIPDGTALRLGLEILLSEGVNTVFAATEDAAYGLMAEGYLVVRMEFVPLHRMQPEPWRRRLVGEMLESRPLDSARAEFMMAVMDSVDSLRLKSALHFLEYDDENSRYRSRFQARPETREEVVPFLEDTFASYLGPYGGESGRQTYLKKLGGDFACTGEFPCDTVFVNVIATKPGRRTGAHYVICAHYDAIASRTSGWSEEWYLEDVPAPGADDNGTGVAILLECARVLAPLDLDVGLKFIAFSGEEVGLLGSATYAQKMSPEDSVLGVLNVDMVGYADESPLLEIIYDWNSEWISDQLEDIHGLLGVGFEVEPFNLSGVPISDHFNFWQIGIPGIMLIEELKDQGSLKGAPVNPYYHTVGDTSGFLDMDMIRGAARMVVGMISRFAEVPEDSLSDISLTEGSVEFDWADRDAGRPPVAGESLTVDVRALNLGAAMAETEPYTFEIWQGDRDTGVLIHSATELIEAIAGEPVEIRFTWETDPETYGDVTFTFVLVPTGDGVESDLSNNTVGVSLAIMPATSMLRDVHVTPHPVSFTEGEAKLRFEILHPEGDFNAVMDVRIFDILGAVVARASLEKTPLVHDFGVGKNAVDLSRVVSGRIAPGLYVCRIRLRLLGEPGVFDTQFKFAVDR
jgi:hypothetical protein